MGTYKSSDKKNEIIKTTWEYLLKTGLGNASIGDLCRETNCSQSSLYYWFTNKDDIWISAGKYGLAKVVDALMDYTFNHVDKVDEYFNELLNEVDKYKHELRLALNISTSLTFGERMRNKSKEFRAWYETYAENLMPVFHCSYLQAETFIYSIIAFLVDYAIWDEKDKAQMLLDNLRKRVVNKLNTEEQQQ